MFYAHSSRTMANAKFKVPVPMIDTQKPLRRDRFVKVQVRKEITALDREKAEIEAQLVKARVASAKINGRFRSRRALLDTLCRRFGEMFGVSKTMIMGETRREMVVLARQAVFYWLLRSGMSAAGVGRLMSRDHTSVIHGAAAWQHKRSLMGRTLPKMTNMTLREPTAQFLKLLEKRA